MKKIVVLIILLTTITFVTFYHHNLGADRNRMQLTSPAFKLYEPLPLYATCLDEDPKNPPLTWSYVPRHTQSLVLLVEDHDAPHGTFVHWIVYNISPDIHEFELGQRFDDKKYGTQGKNSSGTRNYYPACPPSGLHHYQFKMYALSQSVPPEYGDSYKDIVAFINNHKIGKKAVYIGIFEK